MRLMHLLRACVATLALVGAAAVDRPVLAQSGEPAGDATGITHVMNVGTMQTLFPSTVVPLPQGGGGGGFQDRVKTRETNFPDRSGKTLINVGTPYVNAIFGGLGEGAGISGGIELTTADALGDQFELYADALVSVRKYRQFEVGAIIGKEMDRGEVRFIYTRRTRDNLFGLGPLSDEDSFVDTPTGLLRSGETNYGRETRSIQAGYAHYFIKDKLSAGGYFDFTSTSIYEGDDDADPSIFSLYLPYLAFEAVAPVGAATFSAQLPGLTTGSRIYTYGVYSEADVRSNEKGLTQGFYGYVRYAGHHGKDSIGTFVGPVDFGWNQFTADVRGYIPLFSDKTSFAARFFSDLNSRRGTDVIPFYNLARLGGATSLRGFDTFRFYGEKSALFQLEIRRQLFPLPESKGGGGIDVNIFADGGEVWGLGYEPRADVIGLNYFKTLGQYSNDNFETDIGVGLTARLGKSFALRLDYGHSNETNRVKLNFSRGF